MSKLSRHCGVLVLLLAACTETPQGRLDDYVQRVARAGEVERPEARQALPPLYPRGRERRLPIEPLRVDLLDLFRLQDCDLSQLIAERNSILGRYLTEAGTLAYELAFLARAERCRAWLARQGDGDTPALREPLDALLTAKRQSLPSLWWNSSFGSDAFALAFSLASAPQASTQTADPFAARQALEALLELGAQLHARTPAAADLEQWYRALSERRYFGAWLRSALALATSLEQAAAALERIDRDRLCPQHEPTPRARILQTVFLKIYAGRVQPELARVHSQGREWLPVMRALWQQQTRRTEALERYAARTFAEVPGSIASRLDQAVARHTDAWQAVLGACGLMPDGAR